MKNYHGILIDAAFDDPTYPEKFKLYAKRISVSTGWILFGVEIPEAELAGKVLEIQQYFKSDKPYYAHFYNDEKLIVVFKEKVFTVTPHKTSWNPVIEYGVSLGIPKAQLDFWPNRFQDEIHYFKAEDFVG